MNKQTRIKKSARIGALLLVLLLAVGAMSSCVGMDMYGGMYMTREDVEDMLGDRLLGNVTVEAGDNYNLTVNGSVADDLTRASHALLSSVSVVCNYSSSTAKPQAGSGIIYQLDKGNGDAIIVTNYHVVYSSTAGVSDDITVYLYGQERSDYAIKATYVGGSMNYDIAVLRVSGSAILARSNAVAVTFADSDNVLELDTAIAIGNAAGKGISATAGHVSKDSENITINFSTGSYVKQVELSVMRVDAAVNSGNSGGGLFNDRGELIGVVNAKLVKIDPTDDDDIASGIGYAIPSNVVKYVVDNVLDYCLNSERDGVYRALLGITVTADEMYTEYDTETLRVYKRERVAISAISSGSPVEGRLQVGDIINSITIDGRTYSVTRIHHVVDVMLNARSGSTVSINVTRDGQRQDVSVEITQSLIKQY